MEQNNILYLHNYDMYCSKQCGCMGVWWSVCMGVLKSSNVVNYLRNKNAVYGILPTSPLLAGALRCIPRTSQCAGHNCCAHSSGGSLLLGQEPG